MNSTVIHKKTLSNGLTVLVVPDTTVPKVAVQLWYHVGSAHEKDGERGLAHLLEHMIFKGTKRLSESDINVITSKLSGDCNAFTSFDYTGYLFNFPSQHWTAALDILADCMNNCTFDEQMLNSEVCAVVQELKMYKDDYAALLMEEMTGQIFNGHPYHHPIIGYKSDLWSINSQNLLAFYKKHYMPNNATLVIVGDINVDEAFIQVEQYFGALPTGVLAKKDLPSVEHQLRVQGVKLYRDVQQPLMMVALVLPGLKTGDSYLNHILAWILGQGDGSLLYKRLVVEKQLATNIDATLEELFEYSVLFIQIDYGDNADVGHIYQEIMSAVKELDQSLTDAVIERAVNQCAMEHRNDYESYERRAYYIGQQYLAQKNEQALYEYGAQSASPTFKGQVSEFIKQHANPYRIHQGHVLPIRADDLAWWQSIAEESDAIDKKIIAARQRTLPVIKQVYAESIPVKDPQVVAFPVIHKMMLDNGLSVSWSDRPGAGKIEILLDVPLKHYHDPIDQLGMTNLVYALLTEGTQQLPGTSFMAALEQRGISMSVAPGMISLSVLPQDFTYALSLIYQMMTSATFAQDAIERIKKQIITEIQDFWDTPVDFIGQLARQKIYGSHPYAKDVLGSIESIEKITRNDILSWYKKLSPRGARLAVAGDLGHDDIESKFIVLDDWRPQDALIIEFSAMSVPSEQQRVHAIDMNRDQIALCFAAPSVHRMHQDYDALLLFDQALAGSVLSSMNSYLFALREQTGLFYTIGGSLVTHADEQPGMMYIRTLVSGDRFEQAHQAIKQVLSESIEQFSAQDLVSSVRAISHTMADHLESLSDLCQAMIFLDRFNVPLTYFNDRSERLKNITVEQVVAAVKKYMRPEQFISIRVGRLS